MEHFVCAEVFLGGKTVFEQDNARKEDERFISMLFSEISVAEAGKRLYVPWFGHCMMQKTAHTGIAPVCALIL